jgi:hypothetical protein
VRGGTSGLLAIVVIKELTDKHDQLIRWHPAFETARLKMHCGKIRYALYAKAALAARAQRTQCMP